MREPWKITREMFLSETEIAQLLKHIRSATRRRSGPETVTSKTDELIIELLLFSGIRSSELCHLAVEDCPPTLVKPALLIREPHEKSREVYLPGWLCEKIGGYQKHIRPQLLRSEADKASSTTSLIVNERGKPYERTSLYRRVVRILGAAGLESRASVQLLRHTYGCLAYKQTGGNLLFVQRQLGHAHPMVTAVYAEFVDEQPAVAAEQLGRDFRP